MKQVVNLRSGGCPIRFGSADDEAAYEAEVEEARSQQRVRFAVAPRVTVSTLRGQLNPGDEVRAEDFGQETGPDGYMVPPWRVLQRLVDRGLVLEKG